MASKFYGATGLIGGTDGKLDDIDGAALADGDGAMVVTATTSYTYVLDDDSGAAESSPDVIEPDTNGGIKRWILVAKVTGKYTAANLLTACATNAGALDYSAAGKTLTVEDDAVVSQDMSDDAAPVFAGLEISKDSAVAPLTLSCYHDTEGTSSTITLRKADGSKAAPACVDQWARYGIINFDGYDGSGWHTAARIMAQAPNTPTDGTDMPGSLSFWTTPDGSATITTRVTIGQNGDVTFTENIIMADGKTIGQAAGPLLTFDDTNNYLEITGCSVGVGTVTPATLFEISSGTGAALMTLRGLATTAVGFNLFHEAQHEWMIATRFAADADENLHIYPYNSGTIVLGADTGSSNCDVSVVGGLGLKEIAAARADTAGYGQLWVKNTTPCEPWFTDDIGGDHQLYCEGDPFLMATANKITFRDSALGIYSQADTFMDLFADGGVRIGDSSAGAPTNYVKFAADGDLTFVGTAGLPFGSMCGNHIAWAQAGAVQNTWYNISDADCVDSQLHGVAHDGSGKLTVAVAGMYYVSYDVTKSANAANVHVETGIEVNGSGSAVACGKTHTESKFANVEENVSASGILDLAAAATIEVAVRTTDAGGPDLAVEDINLVCIQIGG